VCAGEQRSQVNSVRKLDGVRKLDSVTFPWSRSGHLGDELVLFGSKRVAAQRGNIGERAATRALRRRKVGRSAPV